MIGGPSSAHQFTPTYPKFEISHVEGILTTKMELFNRRKEIEYYELGVYDDQWKPITFASESKIIQINYLQTKYVNVYVRIQDVSKVYYICTESKLRKEDFKSTAISSKVCSRVKQ